MIASDQAIQIARFGTAEGAMSTRLLEAGPLQCLLLDGVLRRVSWHGVEVLRALDCPVRDENWGTFPQQQIHESFPGSKAAASAQIRQDEIHYRRKFTVAGGALAGTLIVVLRSSGLLKADISFTARENFLTNRAGFSVLHPIKHVVGSNLTVVHNDGSEETMSFPGAIKASQPAVDIVSLKHTVAGIDVNIQFAGELFEMEDQRNWSDASFKTYCRPLALPRPYMIRAGESLHQSIEIQLDGRPAPPGEHEIAKRSPIRAVNVANVPQILFALEPDWLPEPENSADDVLSLPAGFLLRFDEDNAWLDEQLRWLADVMKGTAQYCDVEIVVPGYADRHLYLQALAQRLTGFGITPRHVLALPDTWLVSHQPSGPWPEGNTPEDCVHAARFAFADSRIGIGMLTNFTELNRYPPESDLGAYVTHGTTAIVHAADDLSVLETLEALPQIFASALTLGQARGYRLGLVSIGMRSNPYGVEVARNSDDQRVPMAMRDPRQTGLLGAAFAVAAIVSAAQVGCEAMAVGAPAGPFALNNSLEPKAYYPLFHAISAVSNMQGKPLVELDDLNLPTGTHCILVRHTEHHLQGIVANASLATVDVRFANDVSVQYLDSGSYAAAVLDADWLDNAQVQRVAVLNLEPCAMAFIELQESM